MQGMHERTKRGLRGGARVEGMGSVAEEEQRCMEGPGGKLPFRKAGESDFGICMPGCHWESFKTS